MYFFLLLGHLLILCHEQAVSTMTLCTTYIHQWSHSLITFINTFTLWYKHVLNAFKTCLWCSHFSELHCTSFSSFSCKIEFQTLHTIWSKCFTFFNHPCKLSQNVHYTVSIMLCLLIIHFCVFLCCYCMIPLSAHCFSGYTKYLIYENKNVYVYQRVRFFLF